MLVAARVRAARAEAERVLAWDLPLLSELVSVPLSLLGLAWEQLLLELAWERLLSLELALEQLLSLELAWALQLLEEA